MGPIPSQPRTLERNKHLFFWNEPQMPTRLCFGCKPETCPSVWPQRPPRGPKVGGDGITPGGRNRNDNMACRNGPFIDGLPIKIYIYLVGGLNHLEKYWTMGRTIP